MMTDSNGRDMMRRAKNARATWDLTVRECVRACAVGAFRVCGRMLAGPCSWDHIRHIQNSMCRLLVLTQLGRTLVRQHNTTAGGGTGSWHLFPHSAVHSGILVEGLGLQGFRVSGDHMCNCETRVIVRSVTVCRLPVRVFPSDQA